MMQTETALSRAARGISRVCCPHRVKRDTYTMHTIRVPVLIVGGGLTGLTAAMLLAWRGVSSLVVERHPSTARWPLTRGVHSRTLELLRVVPGFEDDLRAVTPQSFVGYNLAIAESVTGRVIATNVRCHMGGECVCSPAPMCHAGQDRIELVLLRQARRLGADVRFSTVATDVTQDADGVYATLHDLNSGAKKRVHADYLIAADGGRSGVRESLEVGVHGLGALSHLVLIFFEANLRPLVKRSGFVAYNLQNPMFSGAFRSTDDPNVGKIGVEYDASNESVEDYTDERCTEIVRTLMGVPDLALKVLDVRSWMMSARAADRMQVGRVFLAGDAAHEMPCTGCLDSQAAMQDAADLTWKLAMVLQHKAGPQLLETYEAERHPVAEMTTARQLASYIENLRPDRSDLCGTDVAADYDHVAFGYRYRSAAIIADASDDGQPTEDPLHPTGRPGFRTPHVWLERDGVRVSTLDLAGSEFVLFAGPEGDAWPEAASTASSALGVTMECYRIGVDLVDRDAVALVRLGITERGASLVRPDGFVAWRSRDGDAHATDTLMDVLHRILFRSPKSCEASRPRASSSHDGDYPTFPIGIPSFA